MVPSDSDENVSKARARRMNRNARIFCFLVFTLAALGGCSSEPPAKDSKKAGTPLDRIQGKAQVLVESNGTTDTALNAGGPSVYLSEGMHRYRLFRSEECRDSAGQNPGKSPSPGGIERDDRYRSERRWTFCVPFGRHASLPPVPIARKPGLRWTESREKPKSWWNRTGRPIPL